MDNYATHQHPKVKLRLKRHPRFHMHFTPTASSRLNLVERWFREITDKRIRRGSFHSVRQLQGRSLITSMSTKETKAFKWTAKADTILAKVQRARAALDKMQTE